MNPFRIEPPALISFSGGRTSALMLKRIIEAHGGSLPDGVHVGFANTGKESEATLRFVHECESRWGVKVRWLEFVSKLVRDGAQGRFVEVGYNSASRRGEPFDRLLTGKGMLPTGQARFCTEFLKVKVLFDFAESVGLGRPGQFTEVIGLRADEKHRIDGMRNDARNKASQIAFPLSTAGVIKSDIFSFWAAQDFDLKLERGFGNCDQCPLIGERHRIARAQRNPSACHWWAEKEAASGYRFGKVSFVEILGLAAQSPRLPLDEGLDAECGTWCPSTVA